MRGLIYRVIIVGGIASGIVRFIPPRSIAGDRGEQDLIRAARKGDRVAFDQLISLHKEAVRRYLARKVQPADLEDVFQETWLAAWLHFEKFSGNSRFRTWLLAVCSHKVQDHWRSTDRHTSRISPEVQEESLGYIQADFGSLELRESVRAAWAELSDNQRELLDLYYGSELTLAEIAKLLNRNLNTVKYQFYRAHQAAAEHLSPDLLATIRSQEEAK